MEEVRMPELHLYDFDGTLFRSPDKPKWWEQKRDWFSVSESLDEPCLPEKPDGKWWISSTVSSAKKSIANPDVWAIVCTGRGDRTFARWRVPELLKQKGLNFDEVLLAPQTGVAEPFKKAVIKRIIARHPEIDTVHIWEDRADHLKAFVAYAEKLGRRGEGHLVKATRPTATCSPEDIKKVASRYIRRVARRPTPESQAWARDLKARDAHIKGALKAFKELVKAMQPYADRAQAEFPDKDKQSLQRRGRYFVKLVKPLPEFNKYLDDWIGGDTQNPKAYSWRSQILYQLRNVLTWPSKFPLRAALKEVAKQADKGFEAIAISESQGPLRKIVPEDIRAFLPKNIVVEVDPSGGISKVTDRFENEHETLEKKIARMHMLVKKYNAIVTRVRKDLKSGNELTRMASLITAIIMETGIRPGKEGNKVVKVKDGKEVEVETFGATTLGPGHVKFLRNGFAKLEFLGKKGGHNVAELSDRELVNLLQTYVEQAKKGGAKFIFVTKKGVPFTYTDLQRYFRENFDGLSPTDFRKLKATATVLSNLRDEQKGLYARIKAFAKGKVTDLRERVTAEIVHALNSAYTNAQQALSHEDVATTIRSYVNPEIVLRFLSQGSVSGTLDEAVLSGKPKLVFDPDVFVQKALKTAGDRAGGSLLELLDELKDEMHEEGVPVPK